MARGGVSGRGGTEHLMTWRTFGLSLGRRPLVDAAALLGWVQVQEGEAILSAEGRAFVEAPVLARKELFRTALHQPATLVTRVHVGRSAFSGCGQGVTPADFAVASGSRQIARDRSRARWSRGRRC